MNLALRRTRNSKADMKVKKNCRFFKNKSHSMASPKGIHKTKPRQVTTDEICGESSPCEGCAGKEDKFAAHGEWIWKQILVGNCKISLSLFADHWPFELSFSIWSSLFFWPLAPRKRRRPFLMTIFALPGKSYDVRLPNDPKIKKKAFP